MDANTIAMMSMIMASWVTIFVAILWQSNHLDKKVGKLDTRVAGLEAKVTVLDTKVDALDGKVDAMGRDVSDARERLASVEGYLTAPEGFKLRTPQPPATVDPPAEDPGTDQREAG